MWYVGAYRISVTLRTTLVNAKHKCLKLNDSATTLKDMQTYANIQYAHTKQF